MPAPPTRPGDFRAPHIPAPHPAYRVRMRERGTGRRVSESLGENPRPHSELNHQLHLTELGM